MQTTVGEQLKTARMARKASIEDVSRAIHIRPFFIEAIEENRFSDIPSQAQVKGFVRLYAGWLDLPFQPFLDLFEGKVEKPAEITPEVIVQKKRKTTSKPVDEQLKQVAPQNTEPNENVPSVLSVTDGKTENSTESASDIDPQITSAELFLQIGSQLKTCREKLDISVEEIEKLTHIRSRYLVDMEAGNFNDIPSLVQARGLLNGYAAFLNLDSDALLGIFAEALQNRRLELLPPEPAVSTKKTDKKKKATTAVDRTGLKRFLTVDFIVGSVTVTGLVIFAIWSAIQVVSTHNESVSKPPPISDVLRENPTSESAETVIPTVEPTELVRNPDSIGLIPTNRPVENAAAANESATPPVPSLGKASMQVYIIPNQRVFLQVTTGKKVAFLGRAVPGNAYPFSSDDRIEVLSGNAAALQVYYNQKDLGTLGLPGQPLRLIFSKDGISTPTSAVTSAPTSTPMATLTLRPSPTKVPPTVTPLIP